MGHVTRPDSLRREEAEACRDQDAGDPKDVRLS
jgi:hypothetical protein